MAELAASGGDDRPMGVRRRSGEERVSSRIKIKGPTRTWAVGGGRAKASPKAGDEKSGHKPFAETLQFYTEIGSGPSGRWKRGREARNGRSGTAGLSCATVLHAPPSGPDGGVLIRALTWGGGAFGGASGRAPGVLRLLPGPHCTRQAPWERGRPKGRRRGVANIFRDPQWRCQTGHRAVQTARTPFDAFRFRAFKKNAPLLFFLRPRGHSSVTCQYIPSPFLSRSQRGNGRAQTTGDQPSVTLQSGLNTRACDRIISQTENRYNRPTYRMAGESR